MRDRAWPLSAYYFALLALLYLPLVILLVFAFNSGTILVFPLKGLTLHWFAQLFATEALMRSLRNSLLVAAGSSLVATVLATCGAIAFVRFRFKPRTRWWPFRTPCSSSRPDSWASTRTSRRRR